MNIHNMNIHNIYFCIIPPLFREFCLNRVSLDSVKCKIGFGTINTVKSELMFRLPSCRHQPISPYTEPGILLLVPARTSVDPILGSLHLR